MEREWQNQEQISYNKSKEDKKLEPEKIQHEAQEEDNLLSQIPIKELQLTVRAYNVLKRNQVNTVEDLTNYSSEDLLEMKNMGQKAADEIVEVLYERLGITLPSRS